MGLSSLSFYYTSEISQKESYDSRKITHGLAAEQLNTGWLFPLCSRHHSRCADCLRFPAVNQTMIESPREERRLYLVQNCPDYPDYRGPGNGGTTLL
jgi:hypothetical protein